MKRTYVDSGVLIAAALGRDKLGERANAVLSDPAREFVSSDYVRLETVPKPTFFKRDAELRFYEAFFASVALWYPFDRSSLDAGLEEACRSGLGPLDAVHVVLAALAGCDELVTTESLTKSIHRTKQVRVVSIDTD